MTPVPGGQSGTCKRTGGCPRTFCTYQIGPPPTPQIPPPGAICPPPTPADGKISKPAAARRAGASGRGLGPGFLHVPDRPSAHAPNPASWGDSPSSHPTRRQKFWPAAPGRGQGSWRRSRRWLYSSQFLQSRNSTAARIASTARCGGHRLDLPSNVPFACRPNVWSQNFAACGGPGSLSQLLSHLSAARATASCRSCAPPSTSASGAAVDGRRPFCCTAVGGDSPSRPSGALCGLPSRLARSSRSLRRAVAAAAAAAAVRRPVRRDHQQRDRHWHWLRGELQAPRAQRRGRWAGRGGRG